MRRVLDIYCYHERFGMHHRPLRRKTDGRNLHARTSWTWFLRLRLPEPSARIIIATDGNPQYRDALAKLYCEPCIDYGQVIKKREKNRLVAVIREKIFGDPSPRSISTSIVEGYNNKIRQRISRFGRKQLRSQRRSWRMSGH